MITVKRVTDLVRDHTTRRLHTAVFYAHRTTHVISRIREPQAATARRDRVKSRAECNTVFAQKPESIIIILLAVSHTGWAPRPNQSQYVHFQQCAGQKAVAHCTVFSFFSFDQEKCS